LEQFKSDNLISSIMDAGASFILASKITSEVSKRLYNEIPSSEVRGMVYEYLSSLDSRLASTYKYKSRLVVRTSETTLQAFDTEKIAKSLVKETNLDEVRATITAKDVERELSRLQLDYVTAPSSGR